MPCASPRAMTLRAKLTATATATVAVAMLLVSVGLYLLVQHALTHDLQVAMKQVASREVKALRTQGHLLTVKGTRVAVLSADGALLQGAWAGSLPLPPVSRARTEVLRGSQKVQVLFRTLSGGRWLALARRGTAGAVILVRILRYMLVLGSVAVLVAAAISFVIAGEMLSPLRRVVRTASTIAESGEIDRRLGRNGGGEMQELARAFDAMLDRLSHALSQQRQAAEHERQFAAEAAHVLRNPLATVLLNLDYLERSLPLGTEAARAAHDAHGEGQRLLRLTESLLRLARGESVSEGAQRLDFSEVVREAASVAAQGKGHAPAELEIAAHAEVLGDRAALFGMVESIVDNAFKYSSPSSPVAVRLTADRGLVRLSVEDRGVGIARQHLQHVFDRFYRGASDGEGSGLGLAIARAVALAHGGQIRIESEPNAFTRVTVEIPQAR